MLYGSSAMKKIVAIRTATACLRSSPVTTNSWYMRQLSTLQQIALHSVQAPLNNALD
jgi:hypothetical protein